MEGEGMGKEESRTSMEDSTFENLEQDFQAVLKELMGDKSLEKFRVEYEKLHRALKKSHDSEKRLMQKCHDLNSEIVVNTTKVTAALKMSQEDRTTITSLKQEIEKLWKMVDAGHEKEARAHETISQLKMEISNLTKLVEQGAGLNFGQDSNFQELMKEKDKLTKERDDQLQEITQLRNTVKETIELQKAAETQRDQAEATMLELREEITVKSQEVERETRRKTKLEKELQAVKVDLEVRASEVKQKQHQLQQAEEDHRRTEQQLKESRLANEQATKDMDLLGMKLTKLQQDYEQQLMSSETLAGENSEKMAQLRMKEEEVSNLKQELTRIQKIRENLQRRLRNVEESKAEVERSRDTLKQTITSLEREIEANNKQAEVEKKMYDDLLRERDILSKSLRKAEGFTEKQEHLVKIHDQTIKNLQQEIANYREEAKKQRSLISQLERDRDRYGKDASDATQNCLQQMEEVKMKEMQLFQLKKKIVEAESKLKQQQTLYEAVCSDRNACSKNLIEARDEMTEMKRKLKIMSHQINQLKDEIASKESALVKSNMELTHVEREKEALSSELSSRKTELESTKQLLEGQKAEATKLQKVITKADIESDRQKKELEQVFNERDILGTQLIRRNDELALLYEKIKIQQSTMNKGEAQYKQRLEDIRILKLDIKRMRREKNILSKSVANVEDLRRELYHVQREILKERTRCKALEEELENPMNIHRWRKLEGSDPSTFEMLQKIQTLQRRLIQKTEEVVEKELLIQEKEKLYMELKHILARQPGPEVAEQLQIYQQTLKEKTKQMKSMASELNMYESQVSENKVEVERLSRELQEVKKKYFLQKKKEMSVKERERALIQTMAPPIIPPQRSDMPRFTGGGFNLKQAQRTPA